MHAVFRTILKKYNLAAGDFPDIQAFAAKLNEVKFADFHSLSQKQIDELDQVLNVDIPSLMAVITPLVFVADLTFVLLLLT